MVWCCWSGCWLIWLVNCVNVCGCSWCWCCWRIWIVGWCCCIWSRLILVNFVVNLVGSMRRVVCGWCWSWIGLGWMVGSLGCLCGGIVLGFLVCFCLVYWWCVGRIVVGFWLFCGCVDGVVGSGCRGYVDWSNWSLGLVRCWLYCWVCVYWFVWSLVGGCWLDLFYGYGWWIGRMCRFFGWIFFWWWNWLVGVLLGDCIWVFYWLVVLRCGWIVCLVFEWWYCCKGLRWCGWLCVLGW